MKIQTFPSVMADLPVDLAHPNRVLISGLFRETAVVNGERHEFLTFIPEDLEYDSQCLIVALPSGVVPETYFEEVGLKEFAQKHQLFLHLASAPNGWSLADGDYINAVYIGIQARDYYITMQDNIYACGIGDGSVAVQAAAVKMASDWSGIITLGDLTADILTLGEDSHGEMDQGNLELKVQGSKAQLPVWMQVSANTPENSAAVAYWKEQNKVVGEPLKGQGSDFIWMPTPVRMHSEINEEYIAQVRLTVKDEDFSVDTLEQAWAYIGAARRHRGQGIKRLRYFKSPEACGAVKKTAEINGMVRTWYEYVPAGCTPDKKWPLVVCMHGRGGTAETFFDISCLHVVAEARNFIAVFPEAGLHQQKKGGLRNVLLWSGELNGKPIDDVAFIRSMVADIETRLPIDHSRIYACGQSSGGMMSDLLSYAAGDLFAAVAPWSALRSPSRMYTDYPKSSEITPTMWIWGDKDFLNAGHGTDEVLPFALDPEMRGILVEKLEHMGLDIANYELWSTDPIDWCAFPDKNGVPLMVIGKVNDMVHANYPEESWISYDQFLSQFRKEADGTLYYRGRKVER